jgi:hypothetical protein
MFFDSVGEGKFLDIDKISLYRDVSGVLKLKIEGTTEDYPVKPVRYFPLTGDEHYLGLFIIEPDGKIKKETVFITDFKRLDENSIKLIEEELAKSYSLVEIKKIISVKQIAKIGLRWYVKTDNGERTFDVANQQDIYMISPTIVIAKDTGGNKYKIDPIKLDSNSRSILEIYV